ncbi:MAG TPA: diguanylate cyclase [Vicinamibacteria bacterium]|nr:diguanylate cyclase [Vicinamibacteria bacterium]
MRRWRVSFQAKVQLLVLVAVSLPASLMGWYLLQTNQTVLAEKVREALSNHVLGAGSRLDDWMQQRLHEVSRWSASFVVFESVEALSQPGPGADKAQRDLDDYLRSVLGHYQNYESLFVVDPRGRILGSTRAERWEEWGQELLAGSAPERGGVVSPIHRSALLGRPTLLVVHTVQGRHERTIGYFVGRVDLRDLESTLGRVEGDPPCSFWLLDEQGRVRLRDGRVPDAPGAARFPGRLPTGGTEAGAVDRVSVPGVGTLIYAVRRLSGASPGFVVATVSAAGAYRPLHEARARLLMLLLPLVGLVLLTSFLVARSLLRPVLRLSEAAKDISLGDLEVSLPVRGSDELADLTRVFNEMADRLRESQKSLEALAITDGLTGLYNRRHFEATVQKELRLSERDGRVFSLLLLDLDHFKAFNDRWGHTAGDAELKRVAAAITDSIRTTDMAFRYGGEELVVLLYSCPKDHAASVAETIRQAVALPAAAADAIGGRTATVSLGVATFPEDGREVRVLVDAADGAMYAAKAEGRNRVVLARPSAGAPAFAAAEARRRKPRDGTRPAGS